MVRPLARECRRNNRKRKSGDVSYFALLAWNYSKIYTARSGFCLLHWHQWIDSELPRFLLAIRFSETQRPVDTIQCTVMKAMIWGVRLLGKRTWLLRFLGFTCVFCQWVAGPQKTIYWSWFMTPPWLTDSTRLWYVWNNLSICRK